MQVKLQQMNLTKEQVKKGALNNLKTFDENGKWNFFIRQGISCDGEVFGRYELYLGNKLFGSYNTVKAARRAIRRNFIVDKDGNGLIEKDDYNVIKINYV